MVDADHPVPITFVAGGSCSVSIFHARDRLYAAATTAKRTVTIAQTAQAVQRFSMATTTGHLGDTVDLIALSRKITITA